MIIINQKASPEQVADLNGKWLFLVDREEVGIEQGWFRNFSESGKLVKPVTIPHTWNVEEETLSYEGVCWYFLSFIGDQFGDDDEVSLYFEGIFQIADIWLNGEHIGKNTAGYIPFEIDVTSHLVSGKETRLAIRVDNTRRDDQIPARLFDVGSYGWFGYGGIIRPIEMRISGKARITALQIRPAIVEMESCLSGKADLFVDIAVENKQDSRTEKCLVFELIDSEGKQVLEKRESISLHRKESETISFQCENLSVGFWFIDNPTLYTCRVKLLDDDGWSSHQMQERFGFREVFIKGGRIVLNGEPMRLGGISRHADSLTYGHAEPIEFAQRDYEDILALGCKMVRTGHYMESKAVLDFCDENGIFLIPEVPAWQLTANQLADEGIVSEIQNQLVRMVHYMGNRPCVLAWSVGNELESNTVFGRKYIERMEAFIHSLDPTRQYCFASNRLNGAVWRDITGDFVMMNAYFGTWHGPKTQLQPNLEAIIETWPEKTLIVSEWGYADDWELVEGPTDKSQSEYYFPEDDDTHDNQRALLIREQMDAFSKASWIAGVIFWDYQDYRVPNWVDPSSEAIFIYPMGVVTENRARKESWKVLQEAYHMAQLKFGKIQKSKEELTIPVRIEANSFDCIPTHILAGYSLYWQCSTKEGAIVDGRVELPVLTPGMEIIIDVAVPNSASHIECEIHRPGNYIVGENSCEI